MEMGLQIPVVNDHLKQIHERKNKNSFTAAASILQRDGGGYSTDRTVAFRTRGSLQEKSDQNFRRSSS